MFLGCGFLGCGFLIHLSNRSVKNKGRNKNRLYSRAIHCPASMEKHYVQWFILWCLGRVPKHRNHWQEVEGLLFIPKNSQLVHTLSFHSYGVVSYFIFPTGPTALDSDPRGRRYDKNMGHDRNCLYSRAIHSPTSMEKHYVQWFILKSV